MSFQAPSPSYLSRFGTDTAWVVLACTPKSLRTLPVNKPMKTVSIDITDIATGPHTQVLLRTHCCRSLWKCMKCNASHGSSQVTEVRLRQLVCFCERNLRIFRSSLSQQCIGLIRGDGCQWLVADWPFYSLNIISFFLLHLAYWPVL